MLKFFPSFQSWGMNNMDDFLNIPAIRKDMNYQWISVLKDLQDTDLATFFIFFCFTQNLNDICHILTRFAS